MDNFKILEQTVDQDINPNGAPGSILAANHNNILKTLFSMVGKYTGSPFLSRKNVTVFTPGLFSWDGNPLNRIQDFTVTMSKKTADLNDVGLILETLVLGDIIQFKDYVGRAVFLVYQSHISDADGSGNPTYIVTVKGLADNPNYVYQENETVVCVLSYHKKAVDASPAISTDTGNTATIGGDGKIFVPDSSTSSVEISVQDDVGTEKFKITDSIRFGKMVFDSALKKLTPDFSELVAKVTGKSLIDDTEIARLANLNERFKGKFTTLSALQTAVPTANPGDYAQIDTGGSNPVSNYNWDVEDGWVVGSTSGTGATNTDELIEGTANLYFTGARVLSTILSGFSLLTGGAIVSTDSVLIAFGKIQKQINDLVSGKQDTLVSGTNIKTINGSSILGSGDLAVDDGYGVVTVSASRNFLTSDIKKILLITNNLTLTMPAGLSTNFRCEIDVKSTGLLTMVMASGVTWTGGAGLILDPQKMCTIYAESLNAYRIKGETKA